MDDPNPGAGERIATADIIGQQEIGGFFLFGLAGDAEEIFRFIDDEKRGVLEEDLHAGGQHGFRHGETVGADGDDIAGMQGMIELADGAVVDRDGLMLEPGADLRLLHLRPGGEEVGEKLGGLVHGDGLGHGPVSSKR